MKEKTLRKTKARFWRPRLTEAVNRYHGSWLIWTKCKSRPEPKRHLHPIPSRNYSEFVSNLQDRLETTYPDVRQSLQVGQHPQKDVYDEDIRHTVFETGDLVQLKPGKL